MQKLTVTRGQVMRRAHELKSWNTGPHRQTWSAWLRYAWAEAREGRTAQWVWLTADNMRAHLHNAIATAEAAALMSGRDADWQHVYGLRSDLEAVI